MFLSLAVSPSSHVSPTVPMISAFGAGKFPLAKFPPIKVPVPVLSVTGKVPAKFPLAVKVPLIAAVSVVVAAAVAAGPLIVASGLMVVPAAPASTLRATCKE